MRDRTAVVATVVALGALLAAAACGEPAALRMVQRFLLPPDRQAVDGCVLAGSPAPCD